MKSLFLVVVVALVVASCRYPPSVTFKESVQHALGARAQANLAVAELFPQADKVCFVLGEVPEPRSAMGVPMAVQRAASKDARRDYNIIYELRAGKITKSLAFHFRSPDVTIEGKLNSIRCLTPQEGIVVSNFRNPEGVRDSGSGWVVLDLGE